MKNKDRLQILILLFIVGFTLKACINEGDSEISNKSGNLYDTTAIQNQDTIALLSKIKAKKTRKKKTRNNTESYNNSNSAPTPTVRKRAKVYSSTNGCSSRQCFGSTKKGGRCRNMTTNCSGYCWRHGG